MIIFYPAMIIINYLYLVRGERGLRLVEEFKNETNIHKKIGSILVITYICVSLLMFVIVNLIPLST